MLTGTALDSTAACIAERQPRSFARGPPAWSRVRLRAVALRSSVPSTPHLEDTMKRLFGAALVGASLLASGAATAQDIKVAFISSKTGPLEAYAKQTEAGLTLGLEFLTGGTMAVNG